MNLEPVIDGMSPLIRADQAAAVQCAEHGSESVYEEGAVSYAGSTIVIIRCRQHEAGYCDLAYYPLPKLF